MITLKIIDANQNSYFPLKVENLSFKNIHYGGNSELSFTLNENPLFKNYMVELFNNIHLYFHSTIIFQGYITEFSRNFNNQNYNLRASGLLTDFTNKRIKKTYVLDDIGDFKNWSEKDNKESDEILYGYAQAKDEKGIKIGLLERSYNAEEDGLFELKIDENIERLKARIFISQPANFTTKLVTFDENHSNPYEEKKWENAQKIDEDVILDIVKTEIDKEVYAFNFLSDDGKWTLSNAQIAGGVLDITANTGSGRRNPDANWLSGVDDDFIIEIDFKQDSAVKEGMEIELKLDEDATVIVFDIRGGEDKMRIHYNGIIKASQAFVDDTNWHTAKIRRVGTTYYFSIDGGAEISWDYGIKKAIESIKLEMDSCTGDYDNFKYSWIYSGEEGTYTLNEKRYLQFRVECTGAANITTDKYFSQLENLKLLTIDSEINAANILKDLLLNHTQKLDLDTSLIQDCFNYKDIELCESLDGWAVSDVGNNLNTNPSIEVDTSGYASAVVAAISRDTIEYYHGVASLKAVTGNVNVTEGWYRDVTATTSAGTEYTFSVYLKGSGTVMLRFNDNVTGAQDSSVITLTSTWTRYSLTKTFGAGSAWRYLYVITNVKQAITFYTDAIMHTEGSVLYPYLLTLSLENSIIKEGQHSIKTISLGSGGTLTKILSSTQNLQNKNLLRLWVRSTITGDILKARFGENERYQYEPNWSCQYQANQKPQDAEPIWTLTGTDYGSVSGGILTINKTGSNECSYKRTDIGHNVKGNTILTRMKCDNAGKTTWLGLCDGVALVQLAIYATKIEDFSDATNSYTIDMTKYRNLWLTMKNNFWILYVDGVFAMVGETQITATKVFIFGMDGSANIGKSYWDYVYYFNLGFLRNKRIEKIINVTSNIYEFDFSYDDGNWAFTNASITGGVLDITSSNGFGRKDYGYDDWLMGANDDFILEVDFKQDATGDVGPEICINLVGDVNDVDFWLEGSADQMHIWYNGVTRASQTFVDDTSWHTSKIRRVGTTFYWSIDGGTEISWDYGTARAMEYLRLYMTSITGDFDNLKYSYKDAWQEKIIDLNNFPIATRDAIKYIQFEVLTNDAFTFYIDQIRSNFELTSAYYRDRTAPLNILEDVLAYQDYEWTITKDKKVKFFKVDRDAVDYICPIKNLVFEENSVSYFNKIYLVYFDAMMKRQEIELVDETSKIPFDREHVIGLGGISDVGAKAIGEEQFEFHKKPRYQLDCLVDNFVFDKNGGRINPVEIEPNKNIKFLGIPKLPIFRIISTDYSNDVCRLTLETEEESLPNITKSIIEVL